MRPWLAIPVVVLTMGLWACGAQPKLSQKKIQEKIQELNLVDLKDDQISVGKVTFSGNNQAVAEASVQMTFHLSKSKNGDWRVDSIRLGDRDWIAVKDFSAALNEVKIQNTRNKLMQLRQSMESYRAKFGRYPQAENIIRLTDELCPIFLSEPIRFDGWNRELVYVNVDRQQWRISSSGPDGIPGNADDIVVGP